MKQCNVCGEAFSNASNLKRHLKRHEKLVERYVCASCHKDYQNKANLEGHTN